MWQVTGVLPSGTLADFLWIYKPLNFGGLRAFCHFQLRATSRKEI